jgi:hypothetical protein
LQISTKRPGISFAWSGFFSIMDELFYRNENCSNDCAQVIISRVFVETLAGQEGDPGTVFMAEGGGHFV